MSINTHDIKKEMDVVLDQYNANKISKKLMEEKMKLLLTLLEKADKLK